MGRHKRGTEDRKKERGRDRDTHREIWEAGMCGNRERKEKRKAGVATSCIWLWQAMAADDISSC